MLKKWIKQLLGVKSNTPKNCCRVEIEEKS